MKNATLKAHKLKSSLKHELSEYETFEKCPILFKFKEGENFSRRNPAMAGFRG